MVYNFEDVVGKIMVAPKCPHPNLQNLWICYFTWQKGHCKSDWSWGLDGEIFLDYLERPNLITWVLKAETFLSGSERVVTVEKGSNRCDMASSEDERRERGTKECRWPLKSGKDKEVNSPRASRKEDSLADTQSDLWWISKMINVCCLSC